MSMLIGKDTVVSFHYKLTNSEGEVLDESTDQPMAYLHGAGGIIPGLENELTGKAAGSSFQTVVSPAEGYGEHQPQMVQEVPKNSFPEDSQLEIGMQFSAQTEGGAIPVIITQVSDETVTVDGNHPLAGETLHFEGTIVEVREATAEELDHGHVH